MFDQKEDDKGYIVYVNRYNNLVQNDNPNLVYIINKINEKFASSKYSTYRCACKLFALQKAFYTACIPFETICTILERHRLNQVDDAPCVRPHQLTSLLHDIYFASDRLGYFADVYIQDLEASCSILASFFWNVFDPKRTTPISLLELKQTFLILCETSTFEQIIWEHFSLTSDHNNCVSRHRFESMLNVLSKILAFIDENDHFKNNLISEIVFECFAQSPGLVGLNQYQFNCLWKLSSKFSYYSNILALTKRIRDSEFIVHNAQCSGCGITIQGLRFKCQKCRNLSLCLECFSRGFTYKKHNIGHKMYEISTNEVSKRRFSSIIVKLCNLFTKPAIQQPSTFDNMEAKLIDTNAVELLDVDVSSNSNDTKYQLHTSKKSKNHSMFSNSESHVFAALNQSILNKLLTVLDILEEDKLKFDQKLVELKGITADHRDLYEYFESHSKKLALQLEQLKIIWQKTTKNFPQSSSTPYRTKSSTKRLLNLSSPLRKSINGAELNKSYLEDNKSDLSVRDVSSWFHINKQSQSEHSEADELTKRINHLKIDTQMTNFKDLLLKVREIVDDSYSDNTELAKTTQQLEEALDKIIEEEEEKRKSDSS